MSRKDRPKTDAALDAAGPVRIAAADDARAVIGIRRSKGWGGLAGFAVTATGAHIHGALLSATFERALIGGIAGYFVAWLAAVTAWRWIIRAEVGRQLELIRVAETSSQTGELR